jgi:hypothetical protein
VPFGDAHDREHRGPRRLGFLGAELARSACFLVDARFEVSDTRALTALAVWRSARHLKGRNWNPPLTWLSVVETTTPVEVMGLEPTTSTLRTLCTRTMTNAGGQSWLVRGRREAQRMATNVGGRAMDVPSGDPAVRYIETR